VPINHTELETKTRPPPPSACVKIQTLSGAVVQESKSKIKNQNSSKLRILQSFCTRVGGEKKTTTNVFHSLKNMNSLTSFLPCLLPSPPPLPLSIVQQSM
jgi:hypothetical protein